MDSKRVPWPLNWLEIQTLAELFQREITNQFVEKILIPSRPEFPSGFLKNEWMILFSGKRTPAYLSFCLRPSKPWVALLAEKKVRPAPNASQSSFGLGLQKWLKNRKVLSVEALSRDRTLIVWFADDENNSRIGLLLRLISAHPEAWIVRDPEPSRVWPKKLFALASSRHAEIPQPEIMLELPPDPPAHPPLRSPLDSQPKQLAHWIEKELLQEAWISRRTQLKAHLSAVMKSLKSGLAQAEEQLARAEKEPDWSHYGDLLKTVLHDPPERKQTLEILGESVPWEPGLTLQEQLEKFYQKAKRKKRKLIETRERAEQLLEKKTILLRDLAVLEKQDLSPEEWQQLEQRFLISSGKTASARQATHAATVGKSFLSKDGFQLVAGRNRTENIEVTFKVARGNDLWFHVKGRPGAHVIAIIPAGKTASLDTLLDAAHLAIHYSGGDDWGKTEVDYTFRKHVKKIKDSQEVSYVKNKTLMINPEKSRIQRLLSSQNT